MFASIRPMLTMCHNVNRKLDAVKTVCQLTDDEWSCLQNRCSSKIESIAVRNCIQEYGADLSTLLDDIDTDLDTLVKLECLKNDLTTLRIKQHNEAWNAHVCKNKSSLDTLVTTVDEILDVTGKWYSIISEREDSGSTSSYSDYSGSDTESSSNDDDHSKSDSS